MAKATRTETAQTPAPVTAVIHDKDGILQSKRYVKGAMEFRSPADNLNPLIDLLRPLNCEITVEGSGDVTNANDDSSINRAYSRTMLKVKRTIDEELSYEMGVMFALDLGIPQVKLFRGVKVNACLNQCIFGADDLRKLNVSSAMETEVLTKYVADFNAHLDAVQQRVRTMKATFLTEPQVKERIGEMIVACTIAKRPAGTTSILRSIELLFKATSKYYVKQDGFNEWLFYNSLTEDYNRKIDFFDIPEKSFDAYRLVTEKVSG